MGDFHTTSMCRFMVATQAALRPLNAAPAATRHRRMQRITDEAFYAWSEKAREEKKKCDRDIISLAEFQQWLKESK